MDIHWNDRDLDRLLFYNSWKSADIYICIYIYYFNSGNLYTKYLDTYQNSFDKIYTLF